MDKKRLIVSEWAEKAEQDLEMAKLGIDHRPELREPICFHCQQAAEKYLKAYLTQEEIVFKKAHSLVYLLDIVIDRSWVSDDLYATVEILEDYGVEIRYPGDHGLTAESVTEAFEAVIKVKEIIRSKIKAE